MATSAANTSPLAGTDSRKPSSVAPELEDRDVHSRASNGVISGREERTRGGCDGPPDVREKRDRPLWAVNRVSRSQWNGGFSADSGPSRGHRRRRTFRPSATFPVPPPMRALDPLLAFKIEPMNGREAPRSVHSENKLRTGLFDPEQS